MRKRLGGGGFWVYSGYVGPDHYSAESVGGDEGGCYTLRELASEEEVIAFREKFYEELSGEAKGVVFRVIEGVERCVEPEEIVTKWKLV